MAESRLEIAVDSRQAEGSIRRVRNELEGLESGSAGAVRGTERLTDALSGADRAAGRYYDAAGRMREANGRFVAGAATASTATQQLGRDARSAGVSFHSLRSAAMLAGSALAAIGVTTGVGTAIRQIADFQTAINGLSAVSGATGQALESLEDQARTLGATSQFSAQQAAEGQRFLAQAGFEVNEILGATPGILQLATAAQLDLATAADIASNVLGGMGLEVGELSRVNDVLAATASRSNTNIQQLGDALSYAAPFARAAGVSIEEAAAAIGVMSDAGIQGSRAGTGLLGVIRQLSNVTPAAEAALSAAGLSIEDVSIEARGLQPVLTALRNANLSSADAIKIFGSEAGAAAQVLVSDYTGAITDAEGESQRMADTIEQGLGPAFKSLGSAVSEATLQLGDSGLAGALESAVRGATGVVSVWNGMSREFQDANGVTDEYMQTVEATAKAVELAAALIGGRLVVALGTAGASMLTAAASATTLRTALGFLGGPAGIVIMAAAGLYSFREELGLVPRAADDARREIELLTGSLDDMNAASIDAALIAINAQMFELETRAREARQALDELSEDRTSGALGMGAGNTGQQARLQAELGEIGAQRAALDTRLEELQALGQGLTETGESGSTASDALDRLGETADSVVAKFRPMLNQNVEDILERAGPGATIDAQGQIRDAWGNTLPTLQRQLDAELQNQITAFQNEQNLSAGLKAAAQVFIDNAQTAANEAFASGLVPTGNQSSAPGVAVPGGVMPTGEQDSVPALAGGRRHSVDIKVNGESVGEVQADDGFDKRLADALAGAASGVSSR